MDIIRVSHSQLMTWMRCPARWHWAYVDEWARADYVNFSMSVGTWTHDLLASHYSGNNWVERYQEILSPDSDFKRDLEFLEAVNKAASMVKRYVEEYAPQADKFWEVIAVEYEFLVEAETPMGRKYILNGFIDLVVRNRITGEIACVDHKTYGGGRGANVWDEDSASMSLQLPIYSYAMRELGHNVTHQIYNLLNSREYKRKQPTPEEQFSRITEYRPRSELDAMLVHVGHMVDQMYREDLPRYKAMQTSCSHCPFFLPCSLELKGINPRPIWLSQYKKKEPRELLEGV